MSGSYQIAERFKSLQGEGQFTGTPMAFIRFVGCSVGKKICNACDTDFEQMHAWRGGGTYTANELLRWADLHEHVCLTGGEPFDQDLLPFFRMEPFGVNPYIHIETSGTREVQTLLSQIPSRENLWLCVSPKPGFLEETVLSADEVKIIVPGLGAGSGWPSLEDAERWVEEGKLVYLQPRNARHDVDQTNLRYVLDLIAENPSFRLSVQTHKILKVQ